MIKMSDSNKTPDTIWKIVMTILITGDFAVTVTQDAVRDILPRVAKMIGSSLALTFLVITSLMFYVAQRIFADDGVVTERVKCIWSLCVWAIEIFYIVCVILIGDVGLLAFVAILLSVGEAIIIYGSGIVLLEAEKKLSFIGSVRIFLEYCPRRYKFLPKVALGLIGLGLSLMMGVLTLIKCGVLS